MFLHELTYGLALSPSLQRAPAYDDSAIANKTFDISLEGDNDDWNTASEDECDNLIDGLRGERRDSGIRSVIYFSVVLT